MPSDLIITPNRSTGNPKMDFYDASSNLDASITFNVSNGDLEFALPGGGKIVLGNANQNVQIGGNLTVNGTTTTINSTTTTVDDPIFTLGGDTAPGSDDNKDRGIEFRWHNGTEAKVGFFGYDDSTGKFTFIPNATNSSEVFSGTTGEIDAKLDWSNVLNKPTIGTVTQIDTNNGVTGGPITTTGTIGLTGQALALHNLATNGLIARTGSGTVAGRSIAQGTGISVSNGDGVSGNPTVGVDSTVALRADTHFIGTTSVALNRASANLALTGISSVTLPGATSGTVLLQPAATAGTTTITLPATTGTVVTTGDSGTVTSTMIADGTIVNGDINASAAIAITKLAASTISGISLGNNLATLTISTGLTGTSYNGSTAVTIGIDSSVVTTTGSQVLTNKTFTDSTTLFQDDVDNTKKLAFQLSGITSGQTRTLTVPNGSGTIALIGDKLNNFGAITSSEFAPLISDETGTGFVVFNTSPTIVTSLVTSSTSFDLLNTTATTINFGAAASSLNIGGISTGSSTVNIATGASVSGASKTLNIGTGGVSGSYTYINIGTDAGGSTFINLNSASIYLPDITSVGGVLELSGQPATMSSAGYSNIINTTYGWLSISTGTAGDGVEIGDVDGNQSGTKITIDPVNNYIDLVTPRTLLNGSLTFGDGSVQTTKTPDFILFDMGII